MSEVIKYKAAESVNYAMNVSEIAILVIVFLLCVGWYNYTCKRDKVPTHSEPMIIYENQSP